MTVKEIVADLDELIIKSDGDIRWQLRNSPRTFGYSSFVLEITTLGQAKQVISFTKTKVKRSEHIDTVRYELEIGRLERRLVKAKEGNWRGKTNAKRIANLIKEIETQKTYKANAIKGEKENKKYNVAMKKELMKIVDTISSAKKGIWMAV